MEPTAEDYGSLNTHKSTSPLPRRDYKPPKESPCRAGCRNLAPEQLVRAKAAVQLFIHLKRGEGEHYMNLNGMFKWPNVLSEKLNFPHQLHAQ